MMTSSNRYFQILTLFLGFPHNLLLKVFPLVLFCACDASPQPWPIGESGGISLQPYGGTTNIGGNGGEQFITGAGGLPNGSGGATVDSSVPVEAYCGDGVAAPSEGCDGNDLKGVTCETLDAGTGLPGCTPDCRFDVSSCSKYSNNTTGGTSGSSGNGGASGTIGNSGTGGVNSQPTVCTPNTTETEACSECPDTSRTRQCLANGSAWDLWSECDCAPPLPTECDGQTKAPTWNDDVGPILQTSCGRCHRQASSYSSFTSWRGGSTSWDAAWTQGFVPHSLTGNNLAVYNCWVALGLPEN